MNMQNKSDQIVDEETLWDVEDVARYIKLEPETVRAMTRDGKLPGFKIGRVWRYRRTDVDDLVSQRKDE